MEIYWKYIDKRGAAIAALKDRPYMQYIIDHTDEEIKERRAEIIMDSQQIIMQKNCEKLIDTEIDVIVEGFDRYAECYFGRSKADAPEVDGKVFFTASGDKPKQGDIIKVKVTDYLDCDPVGEMVY